MKKLLFILFCLPILGYGQINIGNDQTICLGDTVEVIALLQGGGQGAGMDTVIAGVHFSNYTASNSTRGWWFQAQSSFTISSIMASEDNSQGISATNQSLEIVDFGMNPPLLYPTATGSHTVLFSAIDTIKGWLNCNIPIVSGNYYGIIGAKHDAGGSTMYNSYGPSGAQTFIIDGNPTTATRLLLQSALSAGSPIQGSYMNEPTGNIGRVNIITGGGVNWYDVSTGQMIGGGDTLFYAPTQSTFVAGVITDSIGQLHSDTMLIDVLNTNVSTTGFSLCNGPVVLTAPSNFATYNWSNGASTSSVLTVNTPGSYYVNCITANGLSCQSDPVTIYAGTIPITLSTPDSVFICQGDTLLIAGPTGFSQYNWSTGATTSAITTTLVGNYTLSVIDGNGCTGTSNTTTVDISPQTISLSATGYSLCNGPVTIDAGSGYSSYLWSNNSTNQAIVVNNAGSYFVTVTYPTGCTALSNTVTIASATGQFYFPINTPGDDSLCQPNGQVILDAGNFATFNWNTGAITQQITVALLGVYYVNVTDSNGCQGVSNPPFEVFNAVNTSAITGSINATQFQTETYSVTQSSGSTYNWWMNVGNIQSGLGTNTVDVIWNVAGQESIYVLETDANGCVGDTVSLVVTIFQASNITEDQSQQISIYPNPFSEETFIHFTNVNTAYTLYLYNITGQHIWKKENLKEEVYKIKKEELAKGVYFLGIETDATTIIKKLTIH